MLLKIEDNLGIEGLKVEFSKEIFSLVNKNRLRLRKFLGWLDDMNTLQDEENYIKRVNNEIITNFAIKLENKIIGTIDFHDLDKDKKLADIGYWIDIDFERKGIITNSCKRLIKYGFDEVNLEEVTIHCNPENIKSENVAKRLGFEFIGITKNHCNLYGVWSDSKKYLLTKEKYYNAVIAQW